MVMLGLIQSEFSHLVASILYGIGLISLVILLRHSFRARRKNRKRDTAKPKLAAGGQLLIQSIELRERFLKQRSALLIPRDGSLTDTELRAILSRLRKLQPDRNNR